MNKGCIYWLFIGFWLEPIIYIFKIIIIIFYEILKSIICFIINSYSYNKNNKFNSTKDKEFKKPEDKASYEIRENTIESTPTTNSLFQNIFEFDTKNATNKIPKTKKEKIYISHTDTYFGEAGRFVSQKDKCSISMIQREFKIGYNRACKIMDELCEAGVVGEEEGAKPRKILMSYEEFEELINEERIGKEEKIELKNEINNTILKEYVHPVVSLLRCRINPNDSFNFEIPFRNIIESKEFKESQSLITFAVGRSIDKKYAISNIDEFPMIIIPNNVPYEKKFVLTT